MSQRLTWLSVAEEAISGAAEFEAKYRIELLELAARNYGELLDKADERIRYMLGVK